MTTHEKIGEIIGTVLEIDADRMSQVAGDDALNDLGMDSLNCVDIVLSIEEEFDVIFNDEELLLENLNTINKLAETVEQKLGLHSVT
ncbi:acyl carrier protein [Xylanibacillus composti]|uniref:Carrier domain-containing protein n=1 Tax=Xylanibacillus composti TaxID=1572762 RepID=A0A8J4H7K5_9BACL|nr:acyl carrier protein [Xylanibacillus composti]MDT9725894.1 acyl carrier protein [Xylanibacillus composti]GIQ71277.1 hypothetical protein XYCOK13_41010 [Xylanibacillus composti]